MYHFEENEGPDQPACLCSLTQAFWFVYVFEIIWHLYKWTTKDLIRFRRSLGGFGHSLSLCATNFQWYSCREFITKTRLFKYIENFTTKKGEKNQIKNSDIFHISAQNIDCRYSFEPPRRGGSNEYPQSMFLSRNKQNNVYPCKPQFYYIKVGFKGLKLYRHVFVMKHIKII